MPDSGETGEVNCSLEDDVGVATLQCRCSGRERFNDGALTGVVS